MIEKAELCSALIGALSETSAGAVAPVSTDAGSGVELDPEEMSVKTAAARRKAEEEAEREAERAEIERLEAARRKAKEEAEREAERAEIERLEAARRKAENESTRIEAATAKR